MLGAVEVLMRERPIDQVTISDICERAGVSRPTFYAQFESKQAVIAALAKSALDEIYDELWLPFISTSPRTEEIWTEQWFQTLKRWETHRDVLAAAGQAWRAEPRGEWHALWGRFVSGTRHLIERARARGDAPPDFDASVLAVLLVSMVENATFLRSVDVEDGLLDDEHFAATLARVWLRAIYGSPDISAGQIEKS